MGKNFSISASSSHSVILNTDGKVFACGNNEYGQCEILNLEESGPFIQVATTETNTFLLDVNGRITVHGRNDHTIARQFLESTRMQKSKFAQISISANHGVFLTVDGQVWTIGENRHGQRNIPEIDGLTNYTQVSAGEGGHTVLLKSDGTVVAIGKNERGQCNIPELEGNVRYMQVAAGTGHTVLLRSDGNVVACGNEGLSVIEQFDGSCCDIPPLGAGEEYTNIAASMDYTLLLKNDGSVVSCGETCDWARCIPQLKQKQKYVQIAAGLMRALLVRNDGAVIACGRNRGGQCSMPGSHRGSVIKFMPSYVVSGGCATSVSGQNFSAMLTADPSLGVKPPVIFTIQAEEEIDDHIIFSISKMSGEQIIDHVQIAKNSTLSQMKHQCLLKIVTAHPVRFVTSSGELLDKLISSKDHRGATAASLIEETTLMTI